MLASTNGLYLSRPFSSPRGHSLEQRLGCLCRPGCPATFLDCSCGSSQCPDGCFGAAQEWRQQAEAAKGQLSALGSTVRLFLSQQPGGGPTLENVLPDYGKTMSAHADVASKYPVENMVKAAYTPAGSGTGSSGSHDSP